MRGYVQGGWWRLDLWEVYGMSSGIFLLEDRRLVPLCGSSALVVEDCPSVVMSPACPSHWHLRSSTGEGGLLGTVLHRHGWNQRWAKGTWHSHQRGPLPSHKIRFNFKIYLELDYFSSPPPWSPWSPPHFSLIWTPTTLPNWHSSSCSCLLTFFLPQAPLKAHYINLLCKILQCLPFTPRVQYKILIWPTSPSTSLPTTLLHTHCSESLILQNDSPAFLPSCPV